MRTYEEPGYAGTRLKDSIVRLLDGTPVCIMTVTPRGGVGYYKIDVQEGDERIQETQLRNLDINPVPLGYTFHKGKAIYLSRSPVREDWRQGLRPTVTLRTFPATGGITNREIAQAITGKYPSVKDAFALLANKMAISIPISRSFAIDKDGNLIYKGRWTVGTMKPNKAYDLADNFRWVNENLEKELAA